METIKPNFCPRLGAKPRLGGMVSMGITVSLLRAPGGAAGKLGERGQGFDLQAGRLC